MNLAVELKRLPLALVRLELQPPVLIRDVHVRHGRPVVLEPVGIA